MKKLILILIAVTLVSLKGNTQENTSGAQEGIQVGIKIGANLSNVYDVQADQFNADPKFGLVAGGFVSIPIGKFLGVQPEILFSQKGYKGTGSILGLNYEYTRTTNYIDVPILFQLKPSEFISLVAGPQFSYLIKQKDVFTSSILSSEQEQDFENDNIRKNVLCFLGGVDFNIDRAVLGLRAGWDIQNNKGDGTSTVPRYKNVWYQCTLGFRL